MAYHVDELAVVLLFAQVDLAHGVLAQRVVHLRCRRVGVLGCRSRSRPAPAAAPTAAAAPAAAPAPGPAVARTPAAGTGSVPAPCPVPGPAPCPGPSPGAAASQGLTLGHISGSPQVLVVGYAGRSQGLRVLVTKNRLRLR